MTIRITRSDLILVAGGCGFIGSHVALSLHKAGYRVRIADIVPSSSFNESICSEMLQGNLCDTEFCKIAVEGVHTVLHFAANMGGMGVIHPENDFTIYAENQAMTLNLLSASIASGVKKFFYASSACVYPDALQTANQKDVSLRETDVWAVPPPVPQGLYGLEKLNSELLLKQYEDRIQVHIARFHNIYGPRGAWNNGREKAPAAMLRKALAAAALAQDHPSSPPVFEIWGTGHQRRSFLFIDDCVSAVIALLNTGNSMPLNIGSDRSISVRELADIALHCAGLEPTQVRFNFDKQKPVGVASRNSNNSVVFQTLGWKPKISLEEGMGRTGAWMVAEIGKTLGVFGGSRRFSALRTLQRSDLISLSSETVRFAVLLPITSRSLEAAGHEDCLHNLASFARSLKRTTWRNTHDLGATHYHVTVYLSIDHDDEFLLSRNKPKLVLQDNGIADVVTLVGNHQKGHVCNHWRDCARRAWEDGCDYVTLMGDDILLQDEGWMEDIHVEYSKLAATKNVPQGFGCVAFTDITFPGMPTFPVLHRTHMDIFSGQVVPEIFTNQDGDPFLFQLYRRWGCSRMINARITNKLGGSGAARYEKKHVDWTFDTLDDATAVIEKWLSGRTKDVERNLTLDIVVPCYRVMIPYLDAILNLRSSKTCSVMFIIIIDNPDSPSIKSLEQKYAHRPDVRIRINKENLGASASRNRGMDESAAEWIYFLDDDVTPQHDLLYQAEKIIREHPKAAGFVGNAQFPPADNIFTASVLLAGVTYFWDIATKMNEDLPWGVTANLIARRNIKDGVKYDLMFPKTGGGEDIDFCRKKRDWSILNGGEGFWPAPDVIVTHPWWYGGERTYWRFYGWSKGDGRLINIFPDLRFWDVGPNSAELLLCCIVPLLLGLAGLPIFWELSVRVLKFGSKAILALILTNILHDLYRHLWRDVEMTASLKTSIFGFRWFLAVMESSLIRMVSEVGRMAGMLERGDIGLLGRRFDWFTNRHSTNRWEERKNTLQRVVLFIVLLLMF